MNKRLPLFLTIPYVFAAGALALGGDSLTYQSPFLQVEFARDQPGFAALAVDSLGKNKLNVDALIRPAASSSGFRARRSGGRIEYRTSGDTTASWIFQASEKQITLRSSYSAHHPAPPLVMDFDLRLCRATLLGLINGDGSIRLPALLHLPDHGTFRITSTTAGKLSLGYEVLPYAAGRPKEKFVRISFPAASPSRSEVEYKLEVTAIYPKAPGSHYDEDPRFDGFRRNFINMFQVSPRFRSLANNSASDACAITVYEYAEVALRTPPLAPGLTALDLVRQTLDRYLGGMKGCGMKGYNGGTPDETGFDFLDAYPSLVIAGADYALGSHDESWLKTNYPGLQAWATKMLDFDRDGDGLLEYPETRESGPWPWNHPANWWDTIWFTNKDAYSNALAYDACRKMAKVARLAGKPEDERYYADRANRLRVSYAPTFYNPATGVLAGWKDTSGKLHDYFFTFVNGMAISLGLVPRPQADSILDRLLAKMNEVGYTRFDLGLPGNLIPVWKADYGDGGVESGEPQKEDGSDTFQNYENGGASACFVYYTIDALYQLGRRQDGDRILFPVLEAFEDGKFQGRGPNGKTYDWKRWDGTPMGYEGLLVDNYLTLLAVLSRKP